MAQINIRMDDNLKNKADFLFEELGLNMTTAVNIFVRQAVRQGGIPFEVTTHIDPFYSAKNQARIAGAISDYESGRSQPVVKTMAELDAMADV